MDEATKEIQQNELEALRAIFMDDFNEVEAKTAWNVKQDAPEFVIRIRPTDDSLRDHVWAGLHVRFSKTYPRTAPQLNVESGRGLSDAQVAEAQALLKQQAAELAGAEMIYELTLTLSDFVTQHNSAAQAARPSFHQQMVERQQAGAQAEREREQAEHQRMQLADMEEQADLQRRIRAELERKQQQLQTDAQRQQHLSEIADAVHSVAGRWAEAIQLLTFDQPISLDPQAPRNGWFTTVALEESSLADALCTVYDAYPTDLVNASIQLSDRFAVQCVSVTSPHYQTDYGRKQLEHVRARIADLAQIRHPNLVSVYGCRLQTVEAAQGGRGQAQCLWVLSDPLLAHDGSTLEDVLESCGSIAVPQARKYLRHMLLALVSLHAAGFTHRSIVPGNVLLTKEARGRFSARLFNTSYREELIELHRLTPLSSAISDAVGNEIRVAPEVVERPDMMGRKNDVWCAGVVGLQMALGVDALHNVAAGSERAVLEARQGEIPRALFAVLAQMLTLDHRQRPTALEALNNPFFVHGLQGEAPVHRQALDSASRGLTFELQRTARIAEDAEPKYFSVAQENIAGLGGRAAAPAARAPKLRAPRTPQPGRQGGAPALRPTASRYYTDFEEIEFLGKGGFGSVVKARNLIDGRFYAIKKIKLDPRDTEGNKKIFREVTTLSRLHHQNVVRYYTTWVEDAIDYDDEDDEYDGSSTGDGDESDFGVSLSHSSWSTEDDAGESSSSEHSSQGSGARYGGGGGAQEDVDVEFGSAVDGESGATDAASGTDKELQAGGRVFSAIRFGTMGDGAGQKRVRTAAAEGPVREFGASQGASEATSADDSQRQQQHADSELSDYLRRGQQRAGHTDLPRRRRAQGRGPRKRQILYIQMEYCENKTLSDLIREGLSEKESWRLFAQILEGLKHIHERGVIHRDLKPVNAFLDGAGEIKIGDFGLATSSFAAIDAGAAQRLVSVDRSVGEDALTADIGTSTYVAPEVTATGSGATRYNQKVDMYSLGIIFFEMCYPMRTGMERANVLHGLRAAEVEFPADFPAGRQRQRQIIRQLLSHSPRQRPSSAELLESELLPARLEDSHVAETIRTIANPAQPYFAKLMDALFAHAADKHIDATYDFRANDVQTEQLNAVFLDRIRELMTRVFRAHAAVELSAPALMPRTDALDAGARPALFVDARGHVVQLPGDQTAPFARYVARTQMTEIKRYCFDRCFVANAAGGQPQSRTAASFDAVTNRSAHAVAAAEVISVACEVLAALPAFHGAPLVLVLNHMAVLDAVLAYCGLRHPEGPADSHERAAETNERHAQFVRSLCACLGSLHGEKPAVVRARVQAVGAAMRVRVPPQALDRLELFVGIRGDVGAVQRDVLARIGSECGLGGSAHATRGAAYVHAAIRGFGELRYVEATARHFGVAIPLVCAPLFSHHYAYYEGAYAFQIVSDRRGGRAPQVLAAGGRYDGLLRRFRHLAGNGSAREPPDAAADDGSRAFARRAGSLHSTDVWQHMFGKDAASIGTQLSQGSAALGTARDVVCVGVQIQLDLVIQEMARYQQHVLTAADPPTFGLWTRKRCDVVVASFGTRPMLKQRIALARELWAAGLRTDFLFNDDPEMTMERLVEICRDQGMNWIVTLKRRPSSASHASSAAAPASTTLSPDKYVFKVKNILRRVECEVARDGLCAWLHADIADQWRQDLQTHEMRAGSGLVSGMSASLAAIVGREGDVSHGAAAGSGLTGAGGGGGPLAGSAAGSGAASSPAAVSSGSARLEVVLVNPQQRAKNLNRSKHKQKLVVTDRAASSVARTINEVKSAPVLAMDLGAELLRRLGGEPSILTDAGFKRVMELCSAHQRAFIVELRAYLERYRREGCAYVWLYSAKDDHATTYKL